VARCMPISVDELPQGKATVLRFLRFQSDCAYLARRRARLERRYPDEWVAVYENRVVAHSSRRRELTRQLRRKELATSNVFIAFVSPKPATFVF
jgi:hypothetical protein